MKRSSDVRWALGWVLLGLSVGAPGAAVGQEALPIEDLRLPLEQHPDGSIKTQLFAKEARIPEQGPIRGRQVRIEFRKPDGTLDATVHADDCMYDREKRTAASTASVRLERADVKIRGVGWQWDAATEKIRLLSQVRVELKRERVKGTQVE
jgi:hypothetical protein